MGEHCPVQTSAVYLVGRASPFPAVPPPSPPSPSVHSNDQEGLCSPIEALSLDAADCPAVDGETAAAPPDAIASVSPPTTAPASAPDSPSLAPALPLSALASTLSSTTAVAATTATTATAATVATGTAAAGTTATASEDTDPSVAARLAGAVHVLATEAFALQSVAQLYATLPAARDGFHEAVEAIVRTQTAQPTGKLVVVGVGKSGHIGRKLVATFNSLAVPASFLHPTEALHGDLGHIRPHDALLFITFSGKTHELVSLLPHVDPALPLILLTAHVTAETCELVRLRNEQQAQARTESESPKATATAKIILLPAPIPVEERVAFGVAAPTASTTTALAVGDALAIVASKELHPSTESVFRRNHPGGAIGDALRVSSGSSSSGNSSGNANTGNETIRHLAVPWCDIPVVEASSPDCADVLRAGYSSANGWVRVLGCGGGSGSSGSSGSSDSDGVAPPSRIRTLLSVDLPQPVHAVAGLVVDRADFVAVAADTKVRSAAAWLRAALAADGLGEAEQNARVVAVMEHGEIVGVLELPVLLAACGEA